MQLKYKLIAIGVLITVLIIALSMISGLVDERQRLQINVQDEIANSSSGEQQIMGPFLVAKFKRRVLTILSDGKTKKMSTEYFYKGLLPERYNFTSNLDTEYRSLGIYKALLYQSDNVISGEFVVPDKWLDVFDGSLEQITMVTHIDDVRGIKNGLNMTLNDQSFELLPSTGLTKLSGGVHSLIDKKWLTQQDKIEFNMTLGLQGMQRLDITPIGKETNVTMSSNWQHPNFIGNSLPRKPSITEKGFTAHWETTFFSTDMPSLFKRCIIDNACSSINKSNLGVSLVDPVNQYLKTERAIKYAFLFIILTLFAFMLFELFKDLSIHPIQYAFVGLAMAIFYLLLLSLSEHMSFNIAYFISSAACAAVLGVYISGVLGHVRHGIIFSSGIVVLYSILFGLLVAEDFALLMGSIFIFFILAVVMVVTRKVNWYQLGGAKSK